MTYFVLQTGVLMLVAYLLGAIAGCLARQFFGSFPDRATADAAADVPKIETSTKTSKPPSASTSTSARFERSLTDAPKTTSTAAASTAARLQDPAPADGSGNTSSPAPSPAPDVAPAPKPDPATPKASASPAAPSPATATTSGSTSEDVTVENSFSPVAVAAAAAAATLAAHSAPAAAPAPATASAPATPTADDLTRIKGIDSATQSRLTPMHITSYKQIAALTPTQVSRIDSELGQPGRISRQNWIEQAQILAKGETTDYARRIDAGEPTEIISTAPTLTVVSSTPAANPAADVAPPLSDAAPARGDLSGLRSVRSEALVGTPSNDGNRDDLKRIRGVGVLIEKKLFSLGVATYEQVANWTQADIDRISQVLDFKGRIERENWVEQARILAAGGHTDFSRRVEGRTH